MSWTRGSQSSIYLGLTDLFGWSTSSRESKRHNALWMRMRLRDERGILYRVRRSIDDNVMESIRIIQYLSMIDYRNQSIDNLTWITRCFPVTAFSISFWLSALPPNSLSNAFTLNRYFIYRTLNCLPYAFLSFFLFAFSNSFFAATSTNRQLTIQIYRNPTIRANMRTLLMGSHPSNLIDPFFFSLAVLSYLDQLSFPFSSYLNRSQKVTSASSAILSPNFYNYRLITLSIDQ